MELLNVKICKELANLNPKSLDLDTYRSVNTLKDMLNNFNECFKYEDFSALNHSLHTIKLYSYVKEYQEELKKPQYDFKDMQFFVREVIGGGIEVYARNVTFCKEVKRELKGMTYQEALKYVNEDTLFTISKEYNNQFIAKM